VIVIGTNCIFDSSEINLLRQIVEVLQNSTIAEERGQDPLSRFWAAYKKVSDDYDGDMLERFNGNMDIVLIFVRDFFFSGGEVFQHERPGWSVLRR
jgi:hypothetical protein